MKRLHKFSMLFLLLFLLQQITDKIKKSNYKEVSNMKHKVSKIKRIGVTVIASICALSSFASISASAASKTTYGEMSNGYLISSTTSYSGVGTTGTGKVTNGGPCSIRVRAYGYYKSGNYVHMSCSVEDHTDNSQSFSASASGYYTLVGSKCFSTFNSATTISATVGNVG